MSSKTILTLLCCLFFLNSCKSIKEEEIIPAEVLYKEGEELLQKKKYAKASEKFFQIYLQHPGNSMTPEAQLKEAECLYLDKNYPEAIGVLDNFIYLYPVHKKIIYAYYFKGLSYFAQVTDIKYDTTAVFNGKQVFEKLLLKFPNNEYTNDVKEKIAVLDDNLKSKSLYIAKFYIKNNNPVAAINILKEILNKNENTIDPVLPESLFRLAECYKMLGLIDESIKYSNIFFTSYPKHPLASKLNKE